MRLRTPSFPHRCTPYSMVTVLTNSETGIVGREGGLFPLQTGEREAYTHQGIPQGVEKSVQYPPGCTLGCRRVYNTHQGVPQGCREVYNTHQGVPQGV